MFKRVWIDLLYFTKKQGFSYLKTRNIAIWAMSVPLALNFSIIINFLKVYIVEYDFYSLNLTVFGINFFDFGLRFFILYFVPVIVFNYIYFSYFEKKIMSMTTKYKGKLFIVFFCVLTYWPFLAYFIYYMIY